MKKLSAFLVVLAFAGPFGGVSSVRADACEVPFGTGSGIPPLCADTSDPSTPTGGTGTGGNGCIPGPWANGCNSGYPNWYPPMPQFPMPAVWLPPDCVEWSSDRTVCFQRLP